MSAQQPKKPAARKPATGATTGSAKKSRSASASKTAPRANNAQGSAQTIEEQMREVMLAPEVATIDLPATELNRDPVTGETIISTDISAAIQAQTGETPVAEPSPTRVEKINTGGLPTRRERLSGEPSSVPEPVTMLTPERVLDPQGKVQKDGPTMGFQGFLFKASLGTINAGFSKAEQHYKFLNERISRRLEGGTKFVPVLTRKGGVGKTSITTMLGMALASVREDRVIAIDANPDRGTLAERFVRTSNGTVRDVVNKAAKIHSFNEFAEYVSRDKTRLDVLASDTDPFLSEAFGERDYNIVADLVERYYSVALTDCGTGIVHSVMKPTLERADGLVIVSGGSFDEARLAAETLTWLESNGYLPLVRKSIVAINTATPGTNMVKIDEIEQHFQSRVRDIVRIPYDPLLAAGSFIDFERLKPNTQEAARELAALVIDGLTGN